jgi:hypothetical protein
MASFLAAIIFEMFMLSFSKLRGDRFSMGEVSS